MNKTELLNMVCKMIENAGYNKYEVYSSCYYTDEKLNFITRRRINRMTGQRDEWLEIEGLTLTAAIVNRHNGTADNVSVDVCVYENKGLCGHCLHKIRVNTKQNETAIRKKVESIMNFYNTFVKVA